MLQTMHGKLLTEQGRYLRPGLSAHTAQALAAGPVSAATPNAFCLNRDLRN